MTVAEERKDARPNDCPRCKADDALLEEWGLGDRAWATPEERWRAIVTLRAAIIVDLDDEDEDDEWSTREAQR